MKNIFFKLIIIIVSIILIAAVGYRYKISIDAIHKALTMRGYHFTEKQQIESKTNGFLRAIKQRNFKQAGLFLLDKKKVNVLRKNVDSNYEYFFSIENVELTENKASVNCKITKRVREGENKGYVKANLSKILLTFSKNQWRISDVSDFVDGIKLSDKRKEITSRKPANISEKVREK